VALLDAIKAVAMFQKVNIPILGVVENMSTFICPDCGKRYDIFGSGGVQRFAQHTKLPFLGEIPIHVPLRERGDAGTTPANFDDPQVAPCLDQIARQLVRELSRRARLHPAMPQLPVLG
jgi:ATP-binding protein involved in chromosome partitioning